VVDVSLLLCKNSKPQTSAGPSRVRMSQTRTVPESKFRSRPPSRHEMNMLETQSARTNTRGRDRSSIMLISYDERFGAPSRYVR